MSEDGILRIIVVDDDPILLKVFGSLASKRYNVRFYSDASEAYERIRTNPGRYQAVLSDIRMPGMDGVEFVSKIRAMEPSMRVALMSADDSEEVRRRVGALDRVLFLPKPFPIESALRQLAL